MQTLIICSDINWLLFTSFCSTYYYIIHTRFLRFGFSGVKLLPQGVFALSFFVLFPSFDHEWPFPLFSVSATDLQWASLASHWHCVLLILPRRMLSSIFVDLTCTYTMGHINSWAFDVVFWSQRTRRDKMVLGCFEIVLTILLKG